MEDGGRQDKQEALRVPCDSPARGYIRRDRQVTDAQHMAWQPPTQLSEGMALVQCDQRVRRESSRNHILFLISMRSSSTGSQRRVP